MARSSFLEFTALQTQRQVPGAGVTVFPPNAFYHCDGNGNVTAMVDSGGNIVARYEYDPYGAILAQSGVLADANLYRFPSKEYHDNSGLVYCSYRFYDPSLQRWLNQDPFGEAGGLNRYGYLGNNPIMHIDRMGKFGGECSLGDLDQLREAWPEY